MIRNIRDINEKYLKVLNYKQYYGTPEEEYPTLIPLVYRKLLITFQMQNLQEIRDVMRVVFQLSEKELNEYFSASFKVRLKKDIQDTQN